MSFTTAVTAMSTPRFRSIGFMPAATSLMPSFMIEAASTVAVVLSRITLRPFGPSVTLTALLRTSMPRSMRSRASVENLTSFADMALNSRWLDETKGGSGGLTLERDHAFDDAHHIRFLHDDEVLAVDLDLCAGPLPEQDAIASLHVERNE